jgi:tetratricopeptide (TPR) repeat protein
MLIVQVCDFGNDGDAHYRLHGPTRQLSRLPGVVAVDCHFYHHLLPELAERADVLVLQFVSDWELPALCERRRAAGRVTVFEANDYFFDLQPWNPVAPVWQDRTVQELFLELLRTSDAVQTSTPELARRWQERGARRVAAFVNHLTEVPPLPMSPERPLTVGWAGSPGHIADWYLVAPLLARWLDAHPDVQLAVMTDELARPFFQLPPERYRFVPFGSFALYREFLATLDVGLAPLLPTEYNRCRSDAKFLEYAAHGVAGVYADLEPYRQSIVPGETGLLAGSPAEMIQCLEQLRCQPALRQQLRQQAHAYVRDHRMLGDRVGERLTWYQSLVGKDAPDVTLPEEVTSAAVRDGNYLQLSPQEPEQVLIEAEQKATANEAAAELSPLAERQPRYLAALQTLGQKLNDRRTPGEALAWLERARQLEPASPRTWSEIGRSWFLLGDARRARAAIEHALRINSRYLPGWQYLLRLLSLARSPEGRDWARRAEAAFPLCYPLALLGARTYPPVDAVGVLRRLLDLYAPTLSPEERPAAMAAFRKAILETVAEAPAGPEVLALLRRACAVFPESARLASQLGWALYRGGEPDEGTQHLARALELRQQTVLYREEFPGEQGLPCSWLLAEHVRRVLGPPGPWPTRGVAPTSELSQPPGQSVR